MTENFGRPVELIDGDLCEGEEEKVIDGCEKISDGKDISEDGITSKSVKKTPKFEQVKEEDRSVGIVKASVWFGFIKALGFGWTAVLLIFLILQSSVSQVMSWWVTCWTGAFALRKCATQM